MKQEKEKVDIVIMWVDGNDPKWQKEKMKYQANKNADASIYRYRDWGLLKYLFRGIEENASWVNKVYFVTWGHLPEWLNTKYEKIKIINHKDYIPKKYLPTFSANTIEDNLHRIDGLSEKFVLFNDDIYIIGKTKVTDFFKDKPLDTVGLNVHCPTMGTTGQFFAFNDVSIINKYFNMKESIRENKRKWYSLKNGRALIRTLILRNCPRFPGFYQHHLPTSMLKSTYKTLWEKEYDILDATCSHRFRETTDVNQWLFKEWQIASGNFDVRSNSFGKSFYVDRDGLTTIKNEMINYIKNSKGKCICINDGEMTDKEFENLVKDLTTVFEEKFPNKSKYEK